MLVKGTQTLTPGFNNLINHTKKLLGYSEIKFKNKKNYAFYLAFLITNNDIENSLQNVDKRIQLLLLEPHKFWLSPALENADSVEIQIKRQIIQYIILSELELVINNNPALSGVIPQIKEFIEQNKNIFLEKFQEHDEIITKIFLQNMDFVLPGKRNSNNIDLITSISISLGSFLAGAYGSLNLGWNYVATTLKTHNLEYIDLPRFYRKIIHRMVGEMIVFGGLAAGFVTYKSVNYVLKSMHAKNKRPWNELSFAQFIDYCKKDRQLAQLVSNEGGIDNFWLRQSPLSKMSGVDFTILRAYIHTELTRLAPDLEVKELYKLLTCSVLDTPPVLSDLSYPIAISAIRKPLEAWPVRANAPTLFVPLLQNYIRLSIIEFMKTESKEKPKFTREQLDQWNTLLGHQVAEIKAKIEQLEMPTFNPVQMLQLYLSVAAVVTSMGALLYMFHYSMSLITNKDTPSPEEVGKIILHALAGGILSSPTMAAMMLSGVYKLISKIHSKYQHYSENRSATTMFFYTEKTMKHFPVLKEIFAEEYDLEEQDDKKIKNL